MEIKNNHPILLTLYTLCIVLALLISASHVAAFCVKKQIQKERQLQQEKFTLLIKEMKWRESRNRNVWGDNEKAWGKEQFHFQSFEIWKKRYKMFHAFWFNDHDRHVLMVRMVRDGHGYEWSVYRDAYRTIYGKDPPPRGVKIIEV